MSACPPTVPAPCAPGSRVAGDLVHRDAVALALLLARYSREASS